MLVPFVLFSVKMMPHCFNNTTLSHQLHRMSSFTTSINLLSVLPAWQLHTPSFPVSLFLFATQKHSLCCTLAFNSASGDCCKPRPRQIQVFLMICIFDMSSILHQMPLLTQPPHYSRLETSIRSTLASGLCMGLIIHAKLPFNKFWYKFFTSPSWTLCATSFKRPL